MLYRYELTCNGEEQGVGILQGLCELGMDDELSDKLTKFIDTNLPMPCICFKHSKSYFTEYGNFFFRQSIQNIINKYNEHGLFEVIKLTLFEKDVKKENVLYSDEFQLIIKDGGYEYEN